MLQYFFYILLAAALAGAGYVGWLFMQGYFSGSVRPGFFGPKPEKRLDVVEQSSLDGRRRLVLIRRDDVEHLIMTGGPVDVVIETNIAPPRRDTEPGAVALDPNRPRSVRAFGQTAGEK